MQLEIEKKIMVGAESMIREYSSQKKIDKKTLANAEATLAQSKDKIEEINDELLRFKGAAETGSVEQVSSNLRRMSVSGQFVIILFFCFGLGLILSFQFGISGLDLNDTIDTLSTSDVSARIQRLMEKIDIEMTIKVPPPADLFLPSLVSHFFLGRWELKKWPKRWLPPLPSPTSRWKTSSTPSQIPLRE